MSDNGFIVERIGAVARCTMNHPEIMNALNLDTGVPIIDGLNRLLADDTVSVIVLRAEGGNFCTGADLAILGENLNAKDLSGMMNRMNSLLFNLHQGPKIVVTEVDGFAVGGGLGLALASDITYATDQAKFCCGFIRIGAVPDLGATYFLTERLGMVKAKEVALTGDIIDADQALAMGMINRVVSREEISEQVIHLATRIAKAQADALAWTKRNLNRARHVDLQTVLDLEAHVQPLMLLTEEHKAAIKKLLG